MRVLRMLAAGAATVTLAWAGPAFADMTGTYTGYGEGAGTTLDLDQAGNALNGIIAGAVDGVLLGTTDGGDNATGVVLLFDVAKLPFTGAFTGAELRLTITGVNGQTTVVPFALDGAAPVPTSLPPPVRPVKPVPQPSPLPPVPDHAAVTEALRTLLEGLAADRLADVTPEVRATFVECLITVTAPLSAAELQTLVDVGFQPDDALIAQFERTVPGIDEAVNACFETATRPPEPTPGPGPAPVPTKPAPGPTPEPIPAPTPPGPVVLDDATVDANLRAVLLGVIAGQLPDATEERRAAAVECLLLAVAPLPAAERQHLADIGFDPDEADAARLETLLPGLTAAVGTCLGGDEPARTEVTLANGATAIVEGGTSHVFEPVDGGYRIAVDALDIVVTAAEIVVSGAATPLPATLTQLMVVVGEDGVTVTVDGAPLATN